MQKQKKIPVRMCSGCMEHKPKKELIRIVRTPEGEVVIDYSGKKAGRGAYICPNPQCLQKAIKSLRIDRVFGIKVSEEIYEKLKEEMNNGSGE